MPDPAASPRPVIHVTADITSYALQRTIDTAPSGATIELGTGYYGLLRPLRIDRDDIAIVGAGSGETVLGAKQLDGPAIVIGSQDQGPKLGLAGDAAEGSRKIAVDSGHGLAAGDWIEVVRANTPDFYDEIGDTLWQKDKSPLRTSLVQVEAVAGDEITLATGLHFDFVAEESHLRRVDLAEGVTLGGISVDYGLGRAEPGRFENTLPEFHRDAVIEVAGTAGLQLFDIAADDVPSHGLNVALSSGLNADSLSFGGAHNRGPGGNGYAVQLRDVFDSQLTGLSDSGMRHSVTFASYQSAVGNVVHIAETDRDVNFHGGRDHGNVVRVDRMIRDADLDHMSPSVFFNSGTSYGAPTDAGANRVEISELVGSRRSDVVSGTSGSDRLDGARGDDWLSGGDGDDVLIGGDGDDLLFGGAGRDVAIYAGSIDAYDVTRAEDHLLVRGGVGRTDTDRVASDIEWLLFDDAALRGSDGARIARSEVEDFLSEPSRWSPAAGTWQSGSETPADEAPEPPAAGGGDEAGGPDAPRVVVPETPAEPAAPLAPPAGSEPETPEASPRADPAMPETEPPAPPEPAPETPPAEPARPVPGLPEAPGTGAAVIEILEGTEDKDVFHVVTEGTVVRGYGQWDVVWTQVDFAMSDDVEKLVLDGTGAIHGSGGANDNILIGNGAGNRLSGGGGDDRIWARRGDDTLEGGAGNDFLDAARGDDLLFGGLGRDTLDGGKGADTFLYRDTAESAPDAADRITDFETGIDRLDLSAIDADTAQAGDQAFAFGRTLWRDGDVLLGSVDGDDSPDFAIDLGSAAIAADDIIL
ncbi:calcium-binding protein [Roseivivax sp. CAU 1761]